MRKPSEYSEPSQYRKLEVMSEPNSIKKLTRNLLGGIFKKPFKVNLQRREFFEKLKVARKGERIAIVGSHKTIILEVVEVWTLRGNKSNERTRPI